jgi:putative FmdB family regulatory protein
LPIYEYRCRKCGAVSEYLEKQGEWCLFPRKCKQCGRRRTQKVVSSFSSTVRRSRTETLNELKHFANVNFLPRQPGAGLKGPPPGGCPYEGMDPAGTEKTRPDKGPHRDANKG